ncbi:pleckstrin homology domain-containing family O member 2 isoform X2 [Dunckerocampus dactyliophorus]|uniref:pleckstrin homology domain-containing family O member 2 isoform X2 n=1 Tax=Dunckerocampus dactyliophorus TaxID=161453 RepID=UPI0024069565|nr:pleckstrin homology domain-containing family O member 2 isoform X2 [Dunckerocampus dactyliophorus]
MEHVTHQEPAQCNTPKFLGKAGWVKKAPCRLLAKYKDRYIQVERTDVVVYANEDLKSCIERLDLQNYDKCHELKSPFKRKHRLVLIRSLKSGNKIHDMKFQAQTSEEKEAWIKALSDGISRAKNKVLDEVKMDESSHLQHFTRERPKGNRNRRPPTRIHLKELAELSSEGTLHLDPAAMPNRTSANVHDTDILGETDNPLEKRNEPEVEENQLQASMLLLAPPEDIKTLPADESTEPTEASTSKESPGPRRKTGPPAPPPKLTSSDSSELAGDFQVRQHAHPPTPPTKDKKPLRPSGLNQEAKDVPEDHVCNRDTTPCTEGFVLEEESNNDFNIQPTEGNTTQAEEILLTDPIHSSPILLQTSQEPNVEEGSVILYACEDAMAASTCTDALNIHSCARFTPPIVPTAPHAPSGSTKTRAASFGDLLSIPSVSIHAVRAVTPSEALSDDLADIEKELTQGTAATSELLSRVRRSNVEGEDGCMAEDLLAEAMEKLKKADQVLREVKKLKLAKTLSKRNSW